LSDQLLCVRMSVAKKTCDDLAGYLVKENKHMTTYATGMSSQGSIGSDETGYLFPFLFPTFRVFLFHLIVLPGFHSCVLLQYSSSSHDRSGYSSQDHRSVHD
jgi:hypothetical protein